MDMENLDDFDDTYSEIVYDSDCIRKKSNWTKSEPNNKLDSDVFNPNLLLKSIKHKSPKLHALLKKIKELDQADMKRDKTNYKHFIFCDVKSSSQGARMLASAFVASGFNLGYKAERKRGVPDDISSEEQINKDSGRQDTPRPPNSLVIPKLPKYFGSLEQILEDEMDLDESEKIGNDKKSPKQEASMKRGGESTPQSKPVNTKKKFNKIELLNHNELKKTKGSNFYLLSSVDIFDQPISVMSKKEMLANYNSRPDNVHGDNIRFIIMDSGFKEGIDLFDVKYVHIFEPPVNAADQKQVIGRGTRTCGQHGLEFHPTKGWPLHVFIYDIGIPSQIQDQFLDSPSVFDFYMKSLNMDMNLVNFAEDIEQTAIFGSVDYELNKAVHEFSTKGQIVTGGGRKIIPNGPPVIIDPNSNSMVTLITGMRVPGISLGEMSHDKMRRYIRDYYGDTKWEDVKMENLCEDASVKRGGSRVISYTPTQRFVKKYFTPQCPVKGMLLWHSTGTGKTCSAIAAASASFAKQGYTIIWVTRTTLKNDIWKNMFDLICNEEIRTMVADGITIPKEHNQRMKLLSDSWKIRPISYKQFSNLVSKQNSYYQRLVDINGSTDPLRKTLLIIDEAHKLYGGGDLSTNERPDMKALHESLMNSYAISGNSSVKVLLMTATPITENPIELVKLVNLCKPLGQQVPDKFPIFSDAFLDENGRFTEGGRKDFLDIISGHISYLNREKDARQFAQPVVQKIEVPMIENVQEVKDMDKRFNRVLLNKDIIALRQAIEAENDKIDDDFRDLESSRFYELRDICEEYEGLVQKGCIKVANDNIRSLVKEAKTHIKGIKDKVKEIRDEIKGKTEYKKGVLTEIKERYEKDPERMSKFVNGMYSVLKYSCVKTVKKSRNIEQMIETDPGIKQLQTQIDLYDERTETFKRELKIMLERHRIKMKEIRDMIKTGELNRLEKFVLKDNLKNERGKFKSHRTTRKKEITKEGRAIRKYRTKLSKQIVKMKTELKKEIREDIRDHKSEKKERKRAKKQLYKTMRKQGRIREEFKEGMIKDLVKKYDAKTKADFLLAKPDLEKEMAEHERKREEKEAERERKREEKEKKDVEKEAERERKREEKDKKDVEKETERERKREEKDKKRVEKENKREEKTRKKREKQLRKTKKDKTT
jgi:hypothetical protein